MDQPGSKMRYVLFILSVLIGQPGISAAAEQLKCDTGPIGQSYGKTAWLLYSCSDSRSIVVVAAPGNPASPFYFVIHPSTTGYQIEGEGTGAKTESDAALAELKLLSVDQIDALIAQTRHSQKSE